jgi:cellulose biosynthesis protein BcsQ
VVLIDTPPTLGPIVRMAMKRSDLILVPCIPGQECLDGFADIRTTAATLSPDPAMRAFLVLTRDWYRICKWSQRAFADAFPGVLYPDVVVPIEVAAAEAGSLHQAVTASAPTSRTARAYRKLARSVATDVGL